MYVLTLINECRSTFGSNFWIVTPCGLLRIHNLLPLGKSSQKKRKKIKKNKKRVSNFVWKDVFSFSLFHNKTNWYLWKLFEVVLLLEYFLTNSSLLFIAIIVCSLHSSSFRSSWYIFCIDDWSFVSSLFLVRSQAFNSKCTHNIDSLSYTRVYGECPVLSFRLRQLS